MKNIRALFWTCLFIIGFTCMCVKDNDSYLLDQTLTTAELSTLIDQSLTIHQLREFSEIDSKPCQSKAKHDGETVMVHTFLYPSNYFPNENRLLLEEEDSTGHYWLDVKVIENQEGIFKELREKIDPESFALIPIFVKGKINSLTLDTWCYTDIQVKCYDLYLP